MEVFDPCAKQTLACAGGLRGDTLEYFSARAQSQKRPER
jgi:hypothetical protein